MNKKFKEKFTTPTSVYIYSRIDMATLTDSVHYYTVHWNSGHGSCPV